MFQIKVDSDPRSQISWQFGGEPVATDRTTQLEDGSLKLTQATLEDTGNWTVQADNNLGTIAREDIMLTVNPERINITVCMINRLPNNALEIKKVYTFLIFLPN